MKGYIVWRIKRSLGFTHCSRAFQGRCVGEGGDIHTHAQWSLGFGICREADCAGICRIRLVRSRVSGCHSLRRSWTCWCLWRALLPRLTGTRSRVRSLAEGTMGVSPPLPANTRIHLPTSLRLSSLSYFFSLEQLTHTTHTQDGG